MSTVLIVEDNPAIYYTLDFKLKSDGYTVVVADTLANAETNIHSQDFDLILLDRNLPDGRGDELLYHVRQEMNLTVPIIIFSATLQHDTVRQLMELGANGYILKPFNLNDLMQLITHWTSRHVAY